MKINPYLNFNGNCAEAFKFYERVLGGKIVMLMTHANTPAAAHTPAFWQDKIMHARLVAGDAVLMGSDSPPEYFKEAAGTLVSLMVDTPEEADRIFGELAEGGAVRMAIEETFWAVRFGMLTDRFGIPWMINCEKAA